MKLAYIISTALFASVMILTLSSCEKGPAEKAGASIDDAAERAGDQIEKVGDKIQDSVDGDRK